jgi:hypothetical protein
MIKFQKKLGRKMLNQVIFKSINEKIKNIDFD